MAGSELRLLQREDQIAALAVTGTNLFSTVPDHHHARRITETLRCI